MRIYGGKIVEATERACRISVFINPDDSERRHHTERLRIDEHTLNSALDPNEPARKEFEPIHIAVITQMARRYSSADNFLFVKNPKMFWFVVSTAAALPIAVLLIRKIIIICFMPLPRGVRCIPHR
jgi:hypothetical protein